MPDDSSRQVGVGHRTSLHLYLSSLCCSSLLHVCSPWTGEDIILSLSTGMTLLTSVTILLNLLFLRPNNLLSFYLLLLVSAQFSFFFPWIFWPPHFEVQCSNSASVWAAVLPGMNSMKGLYHKHCRLCASLHTAVWCDHLILWQGVTAGSWQYLRAADQNVFLESFSLPFSHSVFLWWIISV